MPCRKSVRLRTTLMAAMLAVLLLAACATVPITGRKQLSIIPDSQMNAMSFQQYEQVLAESQFAPLGGRPVGDDLTTLDVKSDILKGLQPAKAFEKLFYFQDGCHFFMSTVALTFFLLTRPARI